MDSIRRALVVILSLALPAAASAEGIAFFTNLKGEVTVDGRARAPLLGELGKGQKVTLGKEAQASVMYIHTGKEYLLKGPGSYTVKDTELESANGMPPVTRSTEWRTNSKVLVQVAQTSSASVRMRSIGPARHEPAAKLLYPTEGAIASLQPTLRWKAADPAAHAQVEVFEVGRDGVLHKASATGGEWRVPAPLKPSSEFAWSVEVAGKEIGNGRFRTLSAEAIKEIAARTPDDRSEFSDRLLFALLLHEHGAKQDAHEVWVKLARERGDLPELAALAR